MEWWLHKRPGRGTKPAITGLSLHPCRCPLANQGSPPPLSPPGSQSRFDLYGIVLTGLVHCQTPAVMIKHKLPTGTPRQHPGRISYPFSHYLIFFFHHPSTSFSPPQINKPLQLLLLSVVLVSLHLYPNLVLLKLLPRHCWSCNTVPSKVAPVLTSMQ